MPEPLTAPTQVIPLYCAYEATAAMTAADVTAVDHLLGELISAVAASPEASASIRLCVAALGGGATIHLPLTDVDSAVSVPAVVPTSDPVLAGAALLKLREHVDRDWEQLRADGLLRQRPLLVLVTGGGPAAPVQDWVDALRAASHGLTDPELDHLSVWPPQLVTVGIGGRCGPELQRLAGPEGDVVERATDGRAVAAAAETVVDLLLDRLELGGNKLLRRWAVPCHELGTSTPAGTLDGWQVMLPQRGDLPEVGPVRFLKYPVPRVLGDVGVQQLLQVVALQDSDLPDELRRAGVDVAWPARLVLDDDDFGTVLGVLRAEPPGATAPRRTLAADGWTCAAGPPLGGAQADPHLSAAENAALFAVTACRALADLVAAAHRHGVVLGAAIGAVTVDLDTAELLVDRADLAAVLPATDPDAVPRRDDDLHRLAGVLRRTLGGAGGAGGAGDAPGGIGDAPAVLDGPGADLMARAADDGTPSPTPVEWASWLEGLAIRLVGPPRLVAADVAPTVVPVGEKVYLSWRTHFADDLTVLLPDGRVLPIPARDVEHGTARVRLTVPGPIRLEARNRYGPVQDVFPTVHVFDPVDLFRTATGAAGNPLDAVAPPLAPVLAPAAGAADMPPYPQVLAHSEAVGEGLAVLAAATDGLQVLLTAQADGARALDLPPLLAGPMDPARWFSAPPDLRPRRRRGRKG